MCVVGQIFFGWWEVADLKSAKLLWHSGVGRRAGLCRTLKAPLVGCPVRGLFWWPPAAGSVRRQEKSRLGTLSVCPFSAVRRRVPAGAPLLSSATKHHRQASCHFLAAAPPATRYRLRIATPSVSFRVIPCLAVLSIAAPRRRPRTAHQRCLLLGQRSSSARCFLVHLRIFHTPTQIEKQWHNRRFCTIL